MPSCQPVPGALPPQPDFEVRLFGPDPARAEVERYIARRYARCHGARIDTFLPVLLAAARHGAWYAALGLRAAAAQPLFLEQYLDLPIEAVIAAARRQPVERAQVVEIGNLAVSSRCAGELLIRLLIEALRGAGFRWLVFTATRPVRALVAGMGFGLHGLATANPARLRGTADAWGRYYDVDPQVMAGDLLAGTAQPAPGRPPQARAAALAGLAQALR